MQVTIRNPLEQFEVLDLFSISTPLLGYRFALTNLGLYVLIATSLILIVNYWIASENRKLSAPSGASLIQESTYATMQSIVKDQIGPSNERYLPLIFSLFIFILFNNLLGMIPYSFTPTSHLVLTLSLSVAIIIGVTIIGFRTHKLAFFSVLVPTGTPLGLVPLLVTIESISYVARAVSLGVRLAANLISGHTLMKILSGFIFNFISKSPLFFIIGILPMFLFTLIMGLELAVAFIQAIVFVILTSSYIRDSINLH